MSTKVSNRVFFAAIVLYVALSLALSFTPILEYIPWNIAINGLSCELVYLIPIFYAVVRHKVPVVEHCRLKKVKISTIFLAVLYTILVEPAMTVMNLISMLFTENTVLGVQDQLFAVSFPVAFLVIAILGPFGEELFYRGILMGSYRKAAGAGKAILLSALLFGLMHMNLNQLSYAIVVGVLFGLLAEASGSMWPGFVAHACINGFSVCAMFLTKDSMESISQMEEIGELTGRFQWNEETQFLLALFLFVTVLCLTVAFGVLVLISKNEGRLHCLQNLKQSGKTAGKEKLFTISLAVAILLCIVFIGIDLVL